jgi:hypothetical protein
VEGLLAIAKTKTITSAEEASVDVASNIELAVNKTRIPQQYKEEIKAELLESFNQSIKDFVTTIAGGLQTPVTYLTEQEEAEIPELSVGFWTNFINAISRLEADNKFLSVKWLMETRFKDDPSFQRATGIALSNGLLVPYYRNNPKNPRFATKCCRLNKEHSMYKKLFA